MRATVMFGAGDVRIENVPDARLIEPTDALVAVTRACICGSDLWPYRTLGHTDIGRRYRRSVRPVHERGTRGRSPRPRP